MIFNAFALGGELEKNVVFGLEFEQQENRTMIFKSCTMTLCIAFCFVTLRYVICTSRTHAKKLPSRARHVLKVSLFDS